MKITKSQIKQIILEEIENMLMENPAVKAAMRVLRGAKSLSAYNNAVKTLKNLGIPAGRIPKWDPVAKAAKTSVAPKTAQPLANLKGRGTTMRARTAQPPKPPKPAADPKAAQAAVKARLQSKQAVRKAKTGSGAPLERPLARIAEREKQLKQMGAPKPGTAAWKQWVKSNPKKVAAIGLSAAAALALGANYMTPDEDGGGGGFTPGPDPEPEPSPEPSPGPGPGLNAEACKTARGVRNLLKKKAEELTGKKGVAALRAIPLKGDDNSWIRDSYRKLWSARKSRSQSEKARLLIVAAWGEDLGCTVADAEDGPGDMITPLTPDVAPDMTPDLDIDPTLKPLPAGAEQTFEEPPEVREDERTKRFKEIYQKRRAMARRAIAKRNKLTDQYVKSYVGRPLRQGETLESWFESQGSKLPAGYTRKVNQYKEFEKKAMAGTADLVVRKLIPALKKLNPNLSKRQLKAFIDDKPITGTGESPADLPQRGQRDTAAMGLTAAERAKLDMTGGPPPLQESKQLDRMKLLAGIQNENK